mmetsp:Transcript_7667/g.31086  ORF Transcript_7667/g.31086 Transcript_7667/m.31086 type:complete len:204 (+) Transcript_7667:539-1150(+)
MGFRTTGMRPSIRSRRSSPRTPREPAGIIRADSRPSSRDSRTSSVCTPAGAGTTARATASATRPCSRPSAGATRVIPTTTAPTWVAPTTAPAAARATRNRSARRTTRPGRLIAWAAPASAPAWIRSLARIARSGRAPSATWFAKTSTSPSARHTSSRSTRRWGGRCPRCVLAPRTVTRRRRGPSPGTGSPSPHPRRASRTSSS